MTPDEENQSPADQKEQDEKPRSRGREESPAPAERAQQRPFSEERSSRSEARPRRHGRRRRRVCVMCADKMKYVDYKDHEFLIRFISDRGRIETRRKTGTCAKHQRALSRAIKRARHLALIPYTGDHVRIAGGGRYR